MAYFRCSTGSASSGDGVALVVTCDQDFAGAVITATNGTDTFTETCPSASPYTVRFEDIPVGTYTISGVAQGQTFTKQYTVLDYTTSLHIIPNGATVTPVNDIQIWLHCADIWDKSYTTIAQVLADASTLQALIASNNATDYMARSTSWASSVAANSNAMTYIGANNYCSNSLLDDSTWRTAICNSSYFESVLNVKIPTMTSNSAPSGTCGGSSYYGSYQFYSAFDKNTSTFWQSSGQPTSQYPYVQYTFPSVNRICLIKYNCYKDVNTQALYYKVDASSDGSSFANIVSEQYRAASNLSDNQQFTHIVNGDYKVIRLYVKGSIYNSYYYSSVRELQVYGRKDV